MDNVFENSHWIWASSNKRKDDRIVFRHIFNIVKPPKKAVCRIAAESHYFLYINGKLVVWEGGLNRASYNYFFYDEIDIAKFLTRGANTLVIDAYFNGREGRNSLCAGGAGLLFESNDLNIYSDETFEALRDPSYFIPSDPSPSRLYASSNFGYDFSSELLVENFHDPKYLLTFFQPSTKYGQYPCSPYGEARKRPIPLFKFSNVVKRKFTSASGAQGMNKYIVDLPRAMHAAPYLEVFASGGETVDIRSDNYECKGAPGDDSNFYLNSRIEYKLRPLSQQYEAKTALFGEKLVFTMPQSVKVIELGYRETGFDCDIEGSFVTDSDNINKLFKRSTYTLLNCMRDNFMDTPYRERAMWAGDASIESEQAMHIFGENAAKLVRKTITEIIEYGDDGIIRSNIPGSCPVEVPSQGLLALSEYGIIAHYFRRYQDDEILRDIFEPCYNYLMNWDLNSDGLIVSRDGNLRWYDNLYNIDEKVLGNALYYSALNFVKILALACGKDDNELNDRIAAVKSGFEKFWDGSGYTSGKFYDDRANAWAILSSLADSSKYSKLSKLLVSCVNASPYMEAFVMEALCKTEKYDYALERMSRFFNMSGGANSALTEDFNIFGSACHGWSCSPISILYKYFAGVTVSNGGKKVSIVPNLMRFNEMEFSVCVGHGVITGYYEYKDNRSEVVIENYSDAEVELILKDGYLRVRTDGDDVFYLTKGKNKFSV